MLEWAGLNNLTVQDALVMAGVLPYLLLAVGRMVPSQHVRVWRDAWERSEAARAREAETSAKVLAYLESADSILRGLVQSSGASHRGDHEADD